MVDKESFMDGRRALDLERTLSQVLARENLTTPMINSMYARYEALMDKYGAEISGDLRASYQEFCRRNNI